MKRTSIMVSTYKVRITFEHDPTELTLDFEPIVNEFNLHKLNQYILCHWQARPKGERGYGFYDGKTNQYHCIDHGSISAIGTAAHFLQIDEREHQTLPTAVILFPDRRIVTTLSNRWAIV